MLTTKSLFLYGEFYLTKGSFLLLAVQREGEGVATNAPRLFLELVQALRHLSFGDLWAINEQRDWGPER